MDLLNKNSILILNKTCEPTKLVKRIKPRKLMTNKNLHSNAKNNEIAANRASNLNQTKSRNSQDVNNVTKNQHLVSSMRRTPWRRDDLKSQLKMRMKTIEFYSNIDFSKRVKKCKSPDKIYRPNLINNTLDISMNISIHNDRVNEQRSRSKSNKRKQDIK